MRSSASRLTPLWARPRGQAEASCVCCGQNAWASQFRILQRCQRCGFIRADLEPTPEEIARLYQERYFRGQEYEDYVAERDSHLKNNAYRWKLVTGLAPDLHSLFEIGCAYGFWLDYSSRQGIECAGIDVCREAVDYAVRQLGQQALMGDFLQIDLPAAHYQAFCMWDTIEHLANPEKFIARIAELLPAGGWLFLSTGDIGSRAARWRGRHWRLIHPPTHLQYFARSTLTRLLERYGLEVEHIRSLSNCRTIGEILGRVHNLSRGPSRWLGGVLSRILPERTQRWGIWMDLGDIMFVAARKKLEPNRS